VKAYKVRICGRVQGVGFRAAVKRHAMKLGMRGYVRNLPDGCVEALLITDSLEGVESLIEKLKMLRTAEIHNVNISEVKIEKVPGSFEVY
jgi:acylphosphatase